MIARKQKKCRVCKEPFSGQGVVCSLKHAIELAKLQREKKQRKIDREHKVKLRSRSEWIKLAQAAFNKFIRLRDADLPCISCGRHHKGQYHAGHYLSTGAHPELRFDESNVHKQCAPCNDHLSGNIVRYRPALIEKIGIEKVGWLEGPHDPKKYTIPEFEAIRDEYNRKAKEITI
jgi:hypothetical protein